MSFGTHQRALTKNTHHNPFVRIWQLLVILPSTFRCTWLFLTVDKLKLKSSQLRVEQ